MCVTQSDMLDPDRCSLSAFFSNGDEGRGWQCGGTIVANTKQLLLQQTNHVPRMSHLHQHMTHAHILHTSTRQDVHAYS